MPDLFLELASEEIPARMQRRAAEDLKRLVTNHLVEAGLTYEGAYASATPRRLVLGVSGVPVRSADRQEERKGPRVGAPAKAVEGFLRAAGLASLDEATVEPDAKKGDYYVARTRVPGRPAIDIAADAIEHAVKTFPWPVSMRWGTASADPAALKWVRPLASICATFGPETEDPDIVPVDIPGVPLGDTVRGHRFHAPDAFRVRRLDDYKASLERAHVVVDLDRRRDQILHDARDAAFALGLELVEDDRLLEEVAGLVEWPVVLVGRFDERALELPDEVIRLTIRDNQKCFVTRDPATGRLANAFVLTANVEAVDGGAAIIAGNERVVRARLADARFFWEQDLRVPLEEHAKKLAGVTFHEKLGSQADRVERIAALARELAPLVGADPDLAERAARLAKADLVTAMVGEFPELQGHMGRRYALAAGEPEEVAAAIEEHYAPQGPGDAVPTAPVSVAVALADKLDQLVTLFSAGEKPTGSGDPFGLRRSALGIIRITLVSRVRLSLNQLVGFADLTLAYHQLAAVDLSGVPARYLAQAGHNPAAVLPIREFVTSEFRLGRDVSPVRFDPTKDTYRAAAYEKDHDGGTSETILAYPVEYAVVVRSVSTFLGDVFAFVIDRLVVLQREEGIVADVVRAVLPTMATVDIVDAVNRVRALSAFLATDDGANLLASYRRAANILHDEERRDGATVTGAPEHNVLVEPQELHLAGAVEVAEVRVREAIAREDYAAAMTALAELRAPVDAFFDAVRVNADDPKLRLNRLRILAALRDVTREIADFSAISG